MAKRSNRHVGLACTAAAIMQAATFPPAYAQSIWTGNTSADWFTGTNWQSGTVPTAADNVFLNTIAPNPTVVNGPGVPANSSALIVGDTGTGQLTISGGGQVLTGAAGGYLGNNSGSTGTMTVTDAGSAWNIGGQLVVGGFLGPALGTLTIQNGGTVTNTEGNVGYAPVSTGTVTVVGSGATWTNSGDLYIGRNGTGTLNIGSGGSVSNVVGRVGGCAGCSTSAVGTATVNGAGATWTNSAGLAVGDSGTGQLTIAGGGQVLTGPSGGFIGLRSGATGTVTVSDAGSTWSISNPLVVGSSGSGTLNILNGGTVSNTAGTIGDASGSTGAVSVTGTGSTWTNSGNVTVGSAGTGALTVGGGGVVNVAGGTGTVVVASQSGSVGTLSIGAAAGSPAATPGTLNAAAVQFGAGTGTLNFNHTASGYVFAPAITGAGSVNVLGGTTILTGANTYTGGTTISGGGLVVNGSLASGVTLNGGTLGGSGSVGSLAINGGTIAPGNSIGTLTVNGNFVQNAGSIYQVEVNAAGQSDRINASGTATINGGTVQVLAQSGNYARNTTYTILNATGGVSGAYAGVTSNFAFLSPSLSYDASNVYLSLIQSQGAFAAGAQTPNQYAVGTVLDRINPTATGDLFNVLSALSVLSNAQGPAALNAISGQPWADFGTMNVNNAALFMNALGQQMAIARGTAGSAQRQALAQACDVEACDPAAPLSAWVSALGGLGSVLGDGNASTLTYNFGGAVAGLDYRFDPRFLIGLGAGYTHGTQWVNSFMGQGWSDAVSVAAYASFTQSGFYLDALAGYAYYNNQLQRQIQIPGLQQRTATGSTGANQFLGQAEAGYKVDIYAPAAASLTPFGRLQISSVTQNALSESGAQSLSLNVAQQTTNSLRTTIGADLGGSIPLGSERKLDLALRLGWQHEFADVGRPITASFAGAPANAFTVLGVTPARDAAVIGLQAATTIAAATQLYLRYDGEVGGGTDNHALNLGVHFSW